MPPKRIAARKARETVRRKDSLDFTTLPGKLSGLFKQKPCRIVNYSSLKVTLLVVVLKTVVTVKRKPILPLRGKILLTLQKAQEKTHL